MDDFNFVLPSMNEARQNGKWETTNTHCWSQVSKGDTKKGVYSESHDSVGLIIIKKIASVKNFPIIYGVQVGNVKFRGHSWL